MNHTVSPQPKISVLMPAYNAEKYIASAIESILLQTFTDFELIIIDDGSSDNTNTIISNYSKKFPRIVALQNKKNIGISATRNTLIELSKGDYIAWQDADDISLPYRLKNQYDFLKSHPKVGICGGYLEFFAGNKTLSVRKFAQHDEELREKIFRQSPVAQPSAMIRKSVLSKSGVFDVTLPQAEDLDLSLRIGLYSGFANLSEILIKYRFNSNSISYRKLKENIINTLKVRLKAEKEYGYHMKFTDRVVFMITHFFKFVPARLTHAIFNLLRNN